jgi:argininosuccinate lyase
MYRSRFTENLDKHTLDYLSSISEDKEIILYDIWGSQAHTIMLYENKIITKKEATKVLLALEKLKKENLSVKSDSEDIHELIEFLVIKKAGKQAGGKMHTARSRNDQVSLDIRMKIRDDINTLCSCLLDMIETLVTLAEQNNDAIMPLYTHLQQAQVGVFSHYLLAYADTLFRDLDRLYVTYGRVNQSPLGAGPVGGTSLPIDRQSTAKMLGFKGLVENSIDATGSRDFVAEYVGQIAILMTNLSRLAEDFILWSTSEFSFIELSDKFASTSSVMPQKKNPDILELTRGKTAQVIGYQMAILSNIKGLPSGYSRDLQQIKTSIWPTSKIAISALLVINVMLKTMKVNKYKMKKAIDAGYSISLDIAEYLVKEGLPFRTAHKIVGHLVQTASNMKKPLSSLSISEIKKPLKEYDVDPKVLYNVIKSMNAHSSLRLRTSLGSSGKSEQTRMILDRKKKAQAYRSGTIKRSNEVKIAYENLTRKIKTITK